MIYLTLFVGGFVLALATLVLLNPHLPRQRNFAGEIIPTSAGLCFIPIILLTLLIISAGFVTIGSGGVAYLLYALTAGITGLLDDFWGGPEARGLRGHLEMLLRGRFTTGVFKVLVLGGGAVVIGMIFFGFTLEALVAAFLLAGSVNLANLLDVRPGRALKFLGVPMIFLLLVAPPAVVLVAIGLAGGAAGLFYFDLKGRIMLGDAGAAIYGSVIGYLVVMEGPGPVWWVAGALILGLTILAEVSSISRLVKEVGILRRFDSWGRGSDE